MDDLHRTYRISIRFLDGTWRARVTHAKGSRLPIEATAECAEGEDVCLSRARQAVDRYIAYLGSRENERISE